jgi:hypothetical protein
MSSACHKLLVSFYRHVIEMREVNKNITFRGFIMKKTSRRVLLTACAGLLSAGVAFSALAQQQTQYFPLVTNGVPPVVALGGLPSNCIFVRDEGGLKGGANLVSAICTDMNPPQKKYKCAAEYENGVCVEYRSYPIPDSEAYGPWSRFGGVSPITEEQCKTRYKHPYPDGSPCAWGVPSN